MIELGSNTCGALAVLAQP